MTLGVPAYAEAKAALLDDFVNGDLDLAGYTAGLAAVEAQFNSVPTLADKIESLIAIKAVIMDAYQAGIGLRGTVATISELPAEADEGAAYKLVNIADLDHDGHLFGRIDGVWVDLGLLTGEKGRSAYEVAVANGFEGSEAEYAALPIERAGVADTAAENADDKAAYAETKGDYANEKGDYAQAQGAAAADVVAAGATILAAKDVALGAQAAAATSEGNAAASAAASGAAATFLTRGRRVSPLLKGRSGGALRTLAKSASNQVLAAFDRLGRMAVQSLQLLDEPMPSRAGVSPWLFSVRDANGSAALAINRDGKTFIDPADETVAILADKLAYAPDARPMMQGVHFMGQSEAQDGGSATPLLTTAMFPSNVFQFSVGQSQPQGDVVVGSTLNFLVPAVDDPARPPFAAVGCGYALQAFARDAGETPPLIITRTDAYSAQPIGTFLPGEDTYNNLITSITRSAAVAKNYAPGYDPAIFFVQGENGPDNRVTYAADLETIIASSRADVAEITGSEPPFIFVQVNAQDTGSIHANTASAQLDVAVEHDGTSVALAGPKYHMPMIDTSHSTTLGRMMMSELLALVRRKIRDVGYFRPLRPAAINIVGSTIVIDWHVPGGPIQFDTDWILPVTNYGFYWTETDGAVTLSSVAITGPAQTTLQLTGNPTVGKTWRLRHANRAQDEVDDQWANARGQLYSDSGVESPFWRLGFAVPRYIRHYGIRFDEVLS